MERVLFTILNVVVFCPLFVQFAETLKMLLFFFCRGGGPDQDRPWSIPSRGSPSTRGWRWSSCCYCCYTSSQGFSACKTPSWFRLWGTQWMQPVDVHLFSSFFWFKLPFFPYFLLLLIPVKGFLPPTWCLGACVKTKETNCAIPGTKNHMSVNSHVPCASTLSSCTQGRSIFACCRLVACATPAWFLFFPRFYHKSLSLSTVTVFQNDQSIGLSSQRD